MPARSVPIATRTIATTRRPDEFSVNDGDPSSAEVVIHDDPLADADETEVVRPDQ
jgi:hypothetical protein